MTLGTSDHFLTELPRNSFIIIDANDLEKEKSSISIDTDVWKIERRRRWTMGMAKRAKNQNYDYYR